MPPFSGRPTPDTRFGPGQDTPQATRPHEHRGIAAQVRRMLPFTGLPLALLGGAAALLLIAGILAVRAARRRHQA